MAKFLTAAEMDWQKYSIPMTSGTNQGNPNVEAPEIVLERCVLWEGKYNLFSSIFRVPKGGLPSSKHRHGWVQALVLEGQLKVETENDGVRFVRAGECYIIESDEPHIESAVEDSVVLITMAEDGGEFLSK